MSYIFLGARMEGRVLTGVSHTAVVVLETTREPIVNVCQSK